MVACRCTKEHTEESIACMARALFATALAQALVPVIALIIWNPQGTSWSPGVLAVFSPNTVFVLLFAGSAFLFRRASVTG